MASIHLLRSQFSRLYSSKFKLVCPSINPNFSLQFRPIHSITPKSSPAEPISESIHGDWRTFSNSQSKPIDSISNGGDGSKNQHNQNPKNQQYQYHPNPKNQQYQHHQNPKNQQYQYHPNPKNQRNQDHPNPKNQRNQDHPNPKNQRNQDHPNPKNQRNQDHPNPKNQRNQDYQNLKNKRNQHRQNPKNKHNQDDQNPIFSRHFHPIHSLTPKLSPQSNAHSKPTNSTNSIKSVGSSGEEGRRNLSLVSEQMVGHSVPGHPITPKSFPETPLIDVNGASEEPISEPSPRRWSTFSSPLSNPTNSIKGIGGSGEEGSRIRVNLSLVSGKETSENMMKSSSLPEQMVGHNAPVRLMDVNPGINHMEGRIRLSGLLGLEVNRLLGGGVVPGSLILVGGDPGVGKSTLALQIAALIAASCDVGGAAPVLYISGEESVKQIRNRADQLSIDTADLFLYSSTVIEDILEKVQLLSPRALVVDSIQSVYLNEVAGSPGGLMQVKECTSALLRFAKKTNIPVLLIGHVTKNGEIAGHEGLEHIVDVVLYMEGEKHPPYRLLRSVKNRFGSTDELGVFEMSESGLEAVSNPSEMFLSEEHSDSDNLVGLAVAVIIDGSRSFLVKVQALCVSGPDVSRLANGVQLSRVGLILSVLKNQLGLKLSDHSIFLNVLSGVSLTETSGDLAVAVAICSSFLEFPLPNRVAFIGEIGLGGELLMVPRIEKRVITLAKLGYKKCVVPESAGKALAGISSEIQIVGCKNLKEVIDKIFRRLE